MTYEYNPPPQYGQPAGPPPNNFLVPAILSTIFCCLPFGIAAIVFAAQVNGKYAAGDMAGANESARKARLFTWISVGAGLVVGVIYGIVLIAAGNSTNS
jgi:predicted secreted protein